VSESIIEIQAAYDYTRASIVLYVRRRYYDEQNCRRMDRLLPSGGWERAEFGETSQPAFELEKPAASMLLDSLRAAGARGEAEIQSSGHLGALNAHLADMRKIVGHKLGVTL
jgi:hypothetical protein